MAGAGPAPALRSAGSHTDVRPPSRRVGVGQRDAQLSLAGLTLLRLSRELLKTEVVPQIKELSDPN